MGRHPLTPTTGLLRNGGLSGLLTLFVVLSGTLVTAPAAHAHTGLASSRPSAESMVTAPLPAVELTFSGRVLLRQVTVTGPSGTSATTGTATIDGAVVTPSR
jgi:copper resistance protein C